MSTAAIGRTATPPCMSRTAATSSPTASTRSARCRAAGWSTSAATWSGCAARSRELRIALPMPLRRSASCCTRSCAATASPTASSICRSPAASRGAIMPFRRPATPPAIVVTARRLDRGQRRAPGADGHRRHHRAGEPLGAGRHQVGRAAAQRARQAGRARAGRPRGLVRRPRRLRHRGRRRRNAWIVTRDGELRHPPGRPRHPARHHPRPWCSTSLAATQDSASRSAPFTVEEAHRRARGLHHRRRARSCMPVVRIDGHADRQRHARAGRRRAAPAIPQACGILLIAGTRMSASRGCCQLGLALLRRGAI